MSGDGGIKIPSSYGKAMRSCHRDQLKEVTKEKLAWLNSKNLRKLVPRPSNCKEFSVCWTFDLRVNSQNVMTRFMAYLIEKAFMHVQGVDFNKGFSSISKYSTVRTVLALNAEKMDSDVVGYQNCFFECSAGLRKLRCASGRNRNWCARRLCLPPLESIARVTPNITNMVAALASTPEIHWFLQYVWRPISPPEENGAQSDNHCRIRRRYPPHRMLKDRMEKGGG